MRTLPFDCYRCNPELPDENCVRCLRYIGLQGQTYGVWTPVTNAYENSSTPGCGYTPMYEDEIIQK